MKVTLQELLDKGYIEDITTERQRKKGTSQYKEIKSKGVPRVGNTIEFAIYRSDNGNITHYRDFTSNPRTIKTKEQFEHILYRVVASNYYMQIRVYAYPGREVQIVVCPPVTTGKIKEKVDKLTNEDIEKRNQFINKLVTLNKIYGGDKAKVGPYRQLEPAWVIPYEVWNSMEKPDWLNVIKITE